VTDRPHVAIGYGYHPVTTATYLQSALEKRTTTTFVGTSWGGRPGFPPTGDINTVLSALDPPVDLYLHVDSGAAWYFPRGIARLACTTACYLIDVHIQPKAQLARAMHFDYAFSAQRDFVTVLRHAGHPQAHWLPLACDSAIHKHYDGPMRYDVGFVGVTSRGYERRRAILERVAQRHTVSDYTQRASPKEMARIYSASRVVFNCSLHGEINMRVFEGPATGALLVTDRVGGGLDDLMTDGVHALMYDDDNEAVALIEKVLADDDYRQTLAVQGAAHVHAHHTYDRRVETLLKTIYGDGRVTPHHEAPLRRASDANVELAYASVSARAKQVAETWAQLGSGPATLGYRGAVLRQVAFCLARQWRER